MRAASPSLSLRISIVALRSGVHVLILVLDCRCALLWCFQLVRRDSVRRVSARRAFKAGLEERPRNDPIINDKCFTSLMQCCD